MASGSDTVVMLGITLEPSSCTCQVTAIWNKAKVLATPMILWKPVNWGWTFGLYCRSFEKRSVILRCFLTTPGQQRRIMGHVFRTGDGNCGVFELGAPSVTLLNAVFTSWAGCSSLFWIWEMHPWTCTWLGCNSMTQCSIFSFPAPTVSPVATEIKPPFYIHVIGALFITGEVTR